MVTCNSDTCPSPSRGRSNAKSNNIVASLLSAEKSKFQRGRGSNTSRTDSSSQITLTGEQITGELFSDNMQLIPFAISPLGLFSDPQSTISCTAHQHHQTAITKHSTTSTNPNFQTPPTWTSKHSPEHRQTSSHVLTPFGNQNNETTTMEDPTKVLIQVPTTHKSSKKKRLSGTSRHTSTLHEQQWPDIRVVSH